MPLDATCPKCKHVFPVTEARHPVGVECTGCATDLTVEYRKRPSPVDPGTPPYELLVKTGKPVATGTDAAPAPKKTRHDDDEEDTKGTGGSMTIVVVAGLGALFLALGGLGTTGYFLFTNLDTSDATINKLNTQTSNQGGNRPGGNNSGGNQGGNQAGTPGQPPPKKTTFELQPVTGPIPVIKPPTLPADSSTIPLPSKIGSVAIGGGGRYIVMHFPDIGKLGVLDANTALITVTDADNGDVKLAAGLSRVVVLAPNTNIMRVYSIQEPKPPEMKLALNKQFDTNAPVNGLRSIAIGSKTNGPMVGIGTFGAIHLMNIAADGIKEVEEARNEKLELHTSMLRATPDGLAFLTFDGFDPSQKVRMAYVENMQWKRRDLSQAPFPGLDAYLYGNGVVIDRTNKDLKVGGVGAGSGSWYVPAICGSGGAFLKIAMVSTTGAKAKKTISVTIHKNGNAETPANGTTPFIGLPEFEGLVDNRSNNAAVPRDKPFDQHFFLLPEAKLLVIVSADKTKMYLRKIELT